MNHITAKVQEIKSVQNLNIIQLTSKDTPLKMMSLDLNDSITKGSRVILTCKPMAIALGKNIEGALSYANQLQATIISLEIGQLLCTLQLAFEEFVLESVITSDSQKKMQLQRGDEVTAFIKSSDLSIAEVLS